MKNIDGRPFECNRCAKCCKWEGNIFLTPSDSKKIADYMKIHLNEFLSNYTRNNGTKLVLKDKDGLSECVFLKDNMCSVWDARPDQCDKYPNKFDKRCPGFHVQKEGTMESKYTEAVQRMQSRMSGSEEYRKAVTDNLYEDLRAGVKTAAVASMAVSESIDAFLDPSKIKVASLDDLFAFNRVDTKTLIHKATHDLWSIQEEKDGGVSITRLFDNTGEPIKG